MSFKEIDIQTKEGLQEWVQTPITSKWVKVEDGKVRRFIDLSRGECVSKSNPGRKRLARKHRKSQRKEIEFKHINYGFCTKHGFGVCPNDCKAITLNNFSPTAEAIFRKPNSR